MKKLLNLLVLVAFLAPAQAGLNVVATTSDLGAIAREIGGGSINLTILAKPTEDAHFVDAKPSFLVQMRKADLVIEGGAELEAGWLHPLIDGSRNPRIDYNEKGHMHGSDGIELLEVPGKLDRSQGDQHSRGNPHYLVDPLNSKIVAQNIARKFSELDPAGTESYNANLKKFQERVDARLPVWLRKLEPYKGASIVAYHNSWPYFAKRFGLKIDLFLEPKPGIPPSPGHLTLLIQQMRSNGTKVIFVDAHVPIKNAQRLAEETGAKIVQVSHFPGAIKGIKDDYISLMDHLVEQTAQALETK